MGVQFFSGSVEIWRFLPRIPYGLQGIVMLKPSCPHFFSESFQTWQGCSMGQDLGQVWSCVTYLIKYALGDLFTKSPLINCHVGCCSLFLIILEVEWVLPNFTFQVGVDMKRGQDTLFFNTVYFDSLVVNYVDSCTTVVQLP